MRSQQIFRRFIGLSLALVLLLGACVASGPQPAPEPEVTVEAQPEPPINAPAAETTAPPTIAVITPYLAQPGTQFYVEGFEAAAAEKGWNVNVIDTAGDVAAVISRMEDVVNQNVDAVVINVDPAQVAAGLQVAADAGVPVFGMDSGTDPLLVTNVTSNGYAMAAETATYVVNRLGGQGRVVMFVFDPFPPVQIRGAVADSIFANNPDIEIVDRITPDVNDGGIADSRAQMEAILAANPDPGSIGAVWAAWDQPALGALQAIEAAGRADEDIVIVGIDANPQAVDAISTGGNFEASVAQDFVGIGSTTADTVERHLAGQTIKESVIYVPTKLVTAANVGGDDKRDAVAGGDSAGKTVAVITPYLAQPGTQFYVEGFEAAGVEKGWNVNVIDTAGDVAAVISRMEDVVNQNVDAVVINVDPAQVAAGLQVAADAGVPVFGMDSGTDPLLVTNVTSNGYAMAAETATYVVNRLGGQGRVVMFVFDPFPPVQIRGAVADAIFANNPDIEIVDRITPDVNDGGIADSRAQMEAILAANPDPGSIGAVWAAWDQPALGALQAIEAAGRTNEGIVIVGIDANPQAVDAISTGGNFEASVAQDFVGIGSTTADTVERHLAGQTIKEGVIYVSTKLVTAANAADFSAE